MAMLPPLHPAARARRRRLVLPVILAATSIASAAGTSAVDPGWRVARERGQWVIDAQAAPRDAVALRLAEISGSTWAFTAGPAALAGARPLTLRWRGHDLAGAWAAVLDGEASHAVQCEPAGCRVWVLGLLRKAPAAAAADAAPAPAPVRRRASTLPAAPGSRSGFAPGEELPSQPLAEDPPGLFPAG